MRIRHSLLSAAAAVLGPMLAAHELAAAPNLSPLVFLPGDDMIAPAAGLQEEPSIAAGGPGYLAVWSDARSSVVSLPSFTAGPYFSEGIGTMRDVYAMRLDASGNPLDRTPIVVDQAVLNQGCPWWRLRGVGLGGALGRVLSV